MAPFNKRERSGDAFQQQVRPSKHFLRERN
jgi:hypothetical protein